MNTVFAKLKDDASKEVDVKISGTVKRITGMTVTVSGISRGVGIGEKCYIHGKRGKVLAEAVGFEGEDVLLLPFGTWEGVSFGDRVEIYLAGDVIAPDYSWIGRVVNALGEPMDSKGFLPKGDDPYFIKNSPPNSFARKRVGEKLETKVKTFDVFTPVCRGQRMGIFAGSGVGKSSLLAMLAKHTNADVVVIGLIGERGREVQDFIQEDLGEEGMKKACLIVSTSDEPSLMRRQAAWTATAVAEYFRDKGHHVLLLLDSVTRFAMAQREIGLSAGEPPTTKGYTPTVFAELPRMLERSGPGPNNVGDITGLFTVLVDGDDHNEPISDAVRGILDGHVVLDRKIADRGRYPAINISKSVSRMLPSCHGTEENIVMKTAKTLISSYEDMEELIKVGAYRHGTNPELDVAINFFDKLDKYLYQDKHSFESAEDAFINIYKMLVESGANIQFPNQEGENAEQPQQQQAPAQGTMPNTPQPIPQDRNAMGAAPRPMGNGGPTPRQQPTQQPPAPTPNNAGTGGYGDPVEEAIKRAEAEEEAARQERERQRRKEEGGGGTYNDLVANIQSHETEEERAEREAAEAKQKEENAMAAKAKAAEIMAKIRAKQQGGD